MLPVPHARNFFNAKLPSYKAGRWGTNFMQAATEEGMKVYTHLVKVVSFSTVIYLLLVCFCNIYNA